MPWYHHLALLECLKSRGDRIAYAALAIENGWSRNVMVHQIELGVADQHGTAITNFKKLMPPVDSDMAEQTLKGEYDLGFLPANAKTKENKLRTMLVDKVAKFMVELGAGFSYVGKGLTINVGGQLWGQALQGGREICKCTFHAQNWHVRNGRETCKCTFHARFWLTSTAE